MYLAKCAIAFLIMYFLYKSEEKLTSASFVIMGLVGIIAGWLGIDTRKDILEYLSNNLYDNVAGYDCTLSVNNWIKIYDNTLFICMLISITFGLVCIIITFVGSNLWDNMADIITYLLAVFMPVTTIFSSLKMSNKYIDPGNLFAPPVAKAVLVLALSVVIRKVIKMYMNKGKSI